MAQAQTEFHPAAPAPIGLRERGALAETLSKTDARSQSRLYSRFVGLMKLVLPLAALAVVSLVIAWPHLDTTDLRFRVGFSVMPFSDAENPSMLNPRYIGADRDNQPFSLTADLARHLPGPGTRVELEMPKADITTREGVWLVLTAENGVYVREAKTLDLAGKVNLFHDQGYEFRTDRARVDLETGSASGNDPVEGQGAFGHLTANGFHLFDKGRTILFKGKSKLTFYPGAERTDP